jgi:hypothetical protein
LFRHRPISILGVSVFLAFCLSSSLAAWMRSEILSDVFQIFWWGATLVFSLKDDKSGGFYPVICGVMLISSIYILRQTFHERSNH